MACGRITDVAVGLVVVSSCGDGAVFQHVHYPLEVALVDDASVVRTVLWVVGIELLPEETVSLPHKYSCSIQAF